MGWHLGDEHGSSRHMGTGSGWRIMGEGVVLGVHGTDYVDSGIGMDTRCVRGDDRSTAVSRSYIALHLHLFFCWFARAVAVIP